MGHFVEFPSLVMDLEAREHLFCSLLQLKTWYEVLVGEVKDVIKEEDVAENDEAQIQRTIGFEANIKSLHWMRAPGTKQHDLGVKGLKHMSVAECTTHIWWKGLPPGDTLVRVDYIKYSKCCERTLGFRIWLVMCHAFLLTNLLTRTIWRIMVGGGCCEMGRRKWH